MSKEDRVDKIIEESSYYDDPRFRIRPFQQIASAVTGAMCTSLFMTPLDVVKTRIQLQQKQQLSNKCFLYCNGLMDHLCPCSPTNTSQTSVRLNGVFDALIKISRSEGVRALWSGLGPTLVSALPSTVIYFVSYEQIKQHAWDIISNRGKYVNVSKPVMPIYLPLLSGMSARVIAVTIVSPLELMRTKMQSQKLNYLQLYKTTKETIAQDGLLTMWRGLRPTIYRDVPFSGVYWTSYETLKKLYNVKEPTFYFSFIAGGVSGCLSAFITTPFDVVKTHQQIEFGEKVIYAEKPSKDIPKGTMQTIRDIYKIHGLKGPFAGLMPRLAKVAPACAIMIGSFEYGKSFFYKYNISLHGESLDYATNHEQP